MDVAFVHILADCFRCTDAVGRLKAEHRGNREFSQCDGRPQEGGHPLITPAQASLSPS